MTTFAKETYVCAVCGATSDFTKAHSSRFGSPDLDLRPPDMERSIIRFWVQECPCCGYANRTVDKIPSPTVTRAWLKSADYRDCEGNAFVNDSARRFYRQYMVCRESGETKGALHAIICAAWMCDDTEDLNGAVACRLIAADLAQDVFFVEPDPKFIILRADLLRRADRFDEVVELAGSAVLPKGKPLLASLLAFERKHAIMKDDRCYRVDQAAEEMESEQAHVIPSPSVNMDAFFRSDLYQMFRFQGWFPERWEKDGAVYLLVKAYRGDEPKVRFLFPVREAEADDRTIARTIHREVNKCLNSGKILTDGNLLSQEETVSLLKEIDDTAARITQTDGDFFRVAHALGWRHKISVLRIGYSRISLFYDTENDLHVRLTVRTPRFPYDTEDLLNLLKADLARVNERAAQRAETDEGLTEGAALRIRKEQELIQTLEIVSKFYDGR